MLGFCLTDLDVVQLRLGVLGVLSDLGLQLGPFLPEDPALLEDLEGQLVEGAYSITINVLFNLWEASSKSCPSEENAGFLLKPTGLFLFINLPTEDQGQLGPDEISSPGSPLLPWKTDLTSALQLGSSLAF